jgi:hypothetical protein
MQLIFLFFIVFCITIYIVKIYRLHLKIEFYKHALVADAHVRYAPVDFEFDKKD